MDSEDILFSKFKLFPKHELRAMGLLPITTNNCQISNYPLEHLSEGEKNV